jgi:hypothetical protein
MFYDDCFRVPAGGKGSKGAHHAPSSGPHAGDKKSKNTKGSGGTKKGEHLTRCCGSCSCPKPVRALLFAPGAPAAAAAACGCNSVPHTRRLPTTLLRTQQSAVEQAVTLLLSAMNADAPRHNWTSPSKVQPSGPDTVVLAVEPNDLVFTT